ncbi:MAG: crossover junction endodeoxyribonuclease RuvC [Fibrobacterales bacterium]
MIILGIDPGSHTTGYAFLNKNGSTLSVLEYGVLKAKPKDSLMERLHTIVPALELLIKEYSPSLLAMEGIFFAKNAKSALILGHVRGAIMAKCSEFNMQYREFAPKSVKMTVTGRGAASKEQVGEMLKRLLGLKEVPKPIDASDALAVAWTGALNKEIV